jgi:hypothetical protein
VRSEGIMRWHERRKASSLGMLCISGLLVSHLSVSAATANPSLWKFNARSSNFLTFSRIALHFDWDDDTPARKAFFKKTREDKSGSPIRLQRSDCILTNSHSTQEETAKHTAMLISPQNKHTGTYPTRT